MTLLDPARIAGAGDADANRFSVENHLPADFAEASLRADVRAGLIASPKTLPPKWFYDARGSDLFEQITRLPEYYPTRSEAEILAREAAAIARISAAGTVVELGSGSSEKTRLLLDAIDAAGHLACYVPVEVSEAALAEAARALLADYPGLRVHAVLADFEHHLDQLPDRGDRRLFVFLGGTIGNFAPVERREFLAGVRANMRPGDHLLLGTDLVKSPRVLVPAYDDAAGVTAEFNRNVLRVINRELGADFAVDTFEHRAIWNEAASRIEMHLVSTVAQQVRIADLDLTVAFAAGESMRTEISTKFHPDTVRAELRAVGLELRQWWTDGAGRYGLSLSEPGPPADQASAAAASAAKS